MRAFRVKKKNLLTNQNQNLQNNTFNHSFFLLHVCFATADLKDTTTTATGGTSIWEEEKINKHLNRWDTNAFSAEYWIMNGAEHVDFLQWNSN